MNVFFKVLWFEDQVLWRPASERKVRDIIERHNLLPEIMWKKGDEEDIEDELKKDYDLILMDYELRGVTGNILIRQLRQLEIYTDVLFYSGNYEGMVRALYNINNDAPSIDPIDGVYFSSRKREELFPKLQKVIDKIVRRMQDIVSLRGVVLDNVSGFENQMQNILVLAINKFTEEQKKSLNNYAKSKLVTPAKNDYIKRIEEIESNSQVLQALVGAPDYFLDSYKKARLIGKVINILTSEYGVDINEKYKRFANAYNDEIIKYRNALGHAMRNNSNDREIYVGEIDGKPIRFNEELFRKLRASINEYQIVINEIEDAFNDI
ncbi:MAG: hypothetical protein NC302_03165 [Bacteroidales bacterium]|nr:hypothetical protein [Bacteroidales bacterium]MCM1414911.1 hypothetical protein [bacterium]MCM1423060.1 hypothetical protein [bacterium]